MPNFILSIKPMVGADHNELISEAYGIAQRLNTNVDFKFNGADVTVYLSGYVLVKHKGRVTRFVIKDIPKHFPYSKED